MPNPLIGVRLPPALLARVDAYAEALRSRTPGLRVSRQQVIEVLLTRALDAEGIAAPATDPPAPPKSTTPAAKKGAKRKARKP